MASDEEWHNITYFRLDRITDMKIIEDSSLTNLKKIKGYENGINYKILDIAREKSIQYKRLRKYGLKWIKQLTKDSLYQDDITFGIIYKTAEK